MILFDQTREIIPAPGVIVQFEIPRAWFEVWEQKEPAQSRLLTDHLASVAEFLAYKAEHPADGTMTVLYSWAPIITASCSILTLNPTIAVAGLAMALQRKRQRDFVSRLGARISMS